MSLGWRVSGAPQTITVAAGATATQIYNAIRDAQPGAVITVESTDAFALNISNLVKRDPGVYVVFQPTQVFYITHNDNSPASNIHFVGGIASYDLVTFDPTASLNYGVYLGIGASKISLLGMKFDQSRNSLFMNNSSDIDIDSCTFQFPLNDCVQGTSIDRVRFNNNINTVICTSWTTGYFNDSTAPRYGVGSSGVIADGGKWVDTSHSDFLQIRENDALGLQYAVRDFTVTNNMCDIDGQGVVNAGNSSDGDTDDLWIRALIANNEIRATLPANCFFGGTDIEFRDNLCAESALYPMIFGTSRVSLVTYDPRPSWLDSARYRGGRCTVGGVTDFRTPGAFITTDTRATPPTDYFQVDGVDFKNPTTINGDTVNASELPRIYRPAWAPTYSRPSNVLPAVVPLNIIKPEILWFGGPLDGNTEPNPPLGRWLTARRGIWRAGDRFGAVEYRWTRNNVAISGATNPNYQVQAADSGQDIRVEVRHQNAVGWSDWVASNPVTAA
jgi:hypothetical protein